MEENTETTKSVLQVITNFKGTDVDAYTRTVQEVRVVPVGHTPWSGHLTDVSGGPPYLTSTTTGVPGTREYGHLQSSHPVGYTIVECRTIPRRSLYEARPGCVTPALTDRRRTPKSVVGTESKTNQPQSSLPLSPLKTDLCSTRTWTPEVEDPGVRCRFWEGGGEDFYSPTATGTGSPRHRNHLRVVGRTN